MIINLAYIQWFQDSPFGTFVQGDNVNVQWDTSTSTFIVNNNGSPISSSSSDIPETFTYSGNSQGFYKQEYILQSSICSGTSLLAFERRAAFPYFTYTTFANHPNCVVPDPTPIVCDLEFDSLPVVTDASTSVSLDGQIVVSASGSNGAVKYKLNLDFAYEDNTGQSSGTFTGLGVGNYLVYARDAANCKKVISVTVGEQKTYGVIYQLEFYDERLQYHHKTQILQLAYTGSITEVKGGATPTVLSLRSEGAKDKFKPIMPTEIIFRMISETEGQFQGLYTNNPDKFRIRHNIDSGSGYSVVWTGKMIPGQFSEVYRAAPYEVESIATDGLASLRKEYFLDDEKNRLTGTYSCIALVAWILDKIGLELNIRCAVNMYADGMNTTASDDPFDQAYVDVYRYYLVTDAPSCWDVLTYILEPYGAQIVQYYNVWNILRTEERIDSFDYREFDSNGAYVSNSSYDPIKNLSPPEYPLSTLVWANKNQVLNLNPGFGTIRLLYDMGLKDNLLVNGDFSVKKYSVYEANVYTGEKFLLQGSVPDLTGFQIVNNGSNVLYNSVDLGDGNVALSMSVTEPLGYIQSEVIVLKIGFTQQINLKFIFKVSHQFIGAYYTKVKIQVTLGTYYLQSSGLWSTAASYIIYYVKAEDLRKFVTFELIVDPPDTSDFSAENFDVKVLAPHFNDFDFSSEAELEAENVADLLEGTRTEIGTGTGIAYFELKNNTDTPVTLEIIRPADYNASTNPFQWIHVASLAYNGTTDFTEIQIDKIQVQVIQSGKQIPGFASLQKPMEQENPSTLDKILYHGSLLNTSESLFSFGLQPKKNSLFYSPEEYVKYYFDTVFVATLNYNIQIADLVFSGYFRDSSGSPYDLWVRDSINELTYMNYIYAEMMATQYSRPWKSITGDITGALVLTPIDTIYDTFNDQKFIPVAFELDFRRMYYSSVELLELFDFSDTVGNVSAAFTTGFSLGFKS